MELILDMGNPRKKAMLLNQIRGLEGWHRFDVVKFRRRRTDQQNRYLWVAFNEPFSDYMRAQGEALTALDAHEILKGKFLRKTIIDRNTGEAYDVVHSTTELTTVEFNEYLDREAVFLGELGIQVPDPSIYHSQDDEQPKQPAKAQPGYWRT